MKNSDVDIERNILRCILQIKNFAPSVFLYGTVIKEHFADLFHQDVFSATHWYYNKFGLTPTAEKLKSIIPQYTTFDKRYDKNSNQKDVWVKSIDRLFSPLNPQSIEEKESDLAMLEEMRKTRLIQKFMVDSSEKLETGKVDVILEQAGVLLKDTKMVDNQMTEGNIVEDFKQHVNLIKQKKLGLIKPVPTGIVGAKHNEEDGTYEIVQFDNYLDGGLYPTEMTLLIGENNVGKSFALMEIPVYACQTAKINSIIFTIEMNKIKAQLRIYSRISGIPYSKFRTGTITKAELEIVRDRLFDWKKKNGILHIVSFDKGATVVDVENKIRDAEHRYGKEFGLISIDYLNDMKPIGKYQNLKGWDAMGEISWDLSNLAKRWNNRKGVPVLTANQKKTTKAGTGSTDWQDAAFSPLPAQHATIGIGIGQTKDDEQFGRIRWDIFKNRDGGKGISFYTFPDFSISKIYSRKKMDLVINDTSGE